MPRITHAADVPEAGQLMVFRLFGEEMGVDIDHVREIVRLPALTPIPRGPSYVAGVCNLRGNVLPVIDTRDRLGVGHHGEADRTTARLLVVSTGGAATGLIVDEMREVMRMPADQLEPPPAACKGVDREMLRGVVKADGGERLIMILDLDQILTVEAEPAEATTPETASRPASARKTSEVSGFRNSSTNSLETPEGSPAQLLSFRVAGDEYAFDIARVSEIIKVPRITAVPNVPPYVKGLVTIRNQLMPIIDLRALLGLAPLRSERNATIDAGAEAHREWLDGLIHALAANRPVTLTTTGAADHGMAEFGQWLDAYNSSSIEVEAVTKQLKRARADLFSAARGLLAAPEKTPDPAGQAEARLRPLLTLILDTLDTLKATMARHILADQRALVIARAGTQLGFLVDRVDEVLRIPRSHIDPTPALATTKREELKAVARLDHGDRLIMIMDESALIPEEIARGLTPQAAQTERTAPAQTAAEEAQLVTFTINNQEYAIPINQVQEITRAAEITPVPHAPAFVDGLTNLRGNVLPVINLRTVFGLADHPTDDRTRIIIADIHNSRTGIRVDSVNEVLRIDANQIDTTPRIVLAEGSNPYMDGVCRLDGGERIIIRLDTQKLLDEQDAKDLDDIADATPDPEPDPPSAPTLIPPDDVLSTEC